MPVVPQPDMRAAVAAARTKLDPIIGRGSHDVHLSRGDYRISTSGNTSPTGAITVAADPAEDAPSRTGTGPLRIAAPDVRTAIALPNSLSVSENCGCGYHGASTGWWSVLLGRSLPSPGSPRVLAGGGVKSVRRALREPRQFVCAGKLRQRCFCHQGCLSSRSAAARAGLGAPVFDPVNR